MSFPFGLIDWENPSSPVSNWFTVKECIYLPKWNRLAEEEDGLNDEVKQNLIDLCNQMDHVRDFFACPIVVHCCYRPQAYNELVNGARNSAHLYGMAIDFHVQDIDCDKVRDLLLPSLGSLEMRMEDNHGASWVHLDIRDPGPEGRFFKP